MKKLTTEEFIAKARLKHGDKYTYEQVAYTLSIVPVIVTCPKHGVFSVRPALHLHGDGCAVCSRKATYKPDEFRKACAAHLPQFDFSKTEYVRAHDKVVVTCPKHGDFSIPATELFQSKNKYKCPSCAKDISHQERQQKEAAKFLSAAKAAYPHLDFSTTIYTGQKNPVTVKCHTHGEFLMAAQSLLKKKEQRQFFGCPVCRNNWRSTDAGYGKTKWANRQRGRVSTFYILELWSAEERFYKVGITHLSIYQRYQKGLPYEYKTVATYKSVDAAEIWELEARIKTAYASNKYLPQTPFQGQHECFSALDGVSEIYLRQLQSSL